MSTGDKGRDRAAVERLLFAPGREILQGETDLGPTESRKISLIWPCGVQRSGIFCVVIADAVPFIDDNIRSNKFGFTLMSELIPATAISRPAEPLKRLMNSPAIEPTPATSGGEKYPEMEWSNGYWLAFPLYLLLVVPVWVAAGYWLDGNASVFSTVTGCLLVGFLGAASFTDIRWRQIPNWITYPAILVGLLINGCDSWLGHHDHPMLGTVGVVESLLGFITLFGGLLVIFSFSGGGAGDVKLVGAIGAFLGFSNGSEAIISSFLICAFLVVGWALVKRGPWKMVGSIARSCGFYWLPRWVEKPSEEQSQLMQTGLPLAPFFTIGTFFIMIRDSWLGESVSVFSLIFG